METEQQETKKSGGVLKVFWGIFTGLSVLTNIVLFFMLIAAAIFVAGKSGIESVEKVVVEGNPASRIAMVNLEGLIDAKAAQEFRRQLKSAEQDPDVKGVIVRVSSPGGTVSSSDLIHHAICKYRIENEKPVVAFMQGMAASGGYYVSVACEQIVAEPTTITGSIGVIMNFFVVQELLEGKLGINPVVIKEGRFKDWPSPFTQVTDEQRQYLEKKVITPAYERFVQLIADGREALTLEEVKKLANGSIYSADEALENGLIDSVGYLEEAISVIEELADIEDAQIIQYEKPFSFASILDSQAKNNLKLDAKTLYELGTPKLQYLFGIQ